VLTFVVVLVDSHKVHPSTLGHFVIPDPEVLIVPMIKRDLVRRKGGTVVGGELGRSSRG
jgi:hypothetical protein